MNNSNGIRRNGTAHFAVLVILAAFAVSCSKSSGTGSGSKGPGSDEVFIQNMAFNPNSITVTVNTTIIWTNQDPIAHTVTSDDGLFDSGNIPSNGTYSHTFTQAGTFSYHCTIHPNMTAVVKVNPAGGA
jgi:plastocyanin